MKITWPPPQVIFVGFESNQQGQAASQEQASSSWPETFQGAFFSSAAAARAPARRSVRTRTDFVPMPTPSLSLEKAYRTGHAPGGGSGGADSGEARAREGLARFSQAVSEAPWLAGENRRG